MRNTKVVAVQRLVLKVLVKNKRTEPNQMIKSLNPELNPGSCVNSNEVSAVMMFQFSSEFVCAATV